MSCSNFRFFVGGWTTSWSLFSVEELRGSRTPGCACAVIIGVSERLCALCFSKEYMRKRWNQEMLMQWLMDCLVEWMVEEERGAGRFNLSKSGVTRRGQCTSSPP